MKNITTFNLKLIGFFLLITALISCEKEYNEIIDEETSNEQLTDPYSVHSFDELNISGNADFSNALAHYGQITDKVAKADVTGKNTKDKELYNFTLDSSTVNQVNLEKYSSFTFKVNRPYPTPTYTENLVIDKYSTGNIRAFLIKYIPSEETKMIEEHNTVHFVGERVVQRLDPDMLGLSARDWCVPVVELWCRWGSEDHIAGPRCIEEAKSSNSVGTRLFLNNTEHCTEIADDDFTTGGGSSPDPGSGGTSGGGGIGGDPDMGTVGTFPNGITTLDSDDDLPLITQWETVVINPLPENPTEKELEEKNKALIAYLYTLNGSVHSEFISILTSNLNDPSLNLADKVWLWERNKKMFELVSFYSYDTDITFDDFYNRLSFSDKKILDKNAAETALLSSVKSVVGQYWPKNADEWAGLFKIMSPLLVDVGIEFLPSGGIVNACRDTFAGLTTGDYTTAVIGVVGVVMEFVPWAKLAKIAAKVYDIGKSAFKIFKVAYTFLADIAATLGKGFKTILDGDNLKLFDKFDNLIAQGDDVRKFALAFGTRIDDLVTDVAKINLPPSVASTFNESAYRTVRTNQSIPLNRVFGNEAKLKGGFATTSANATRNELALLDEWNNSMRFEAVINVPSGQTLNIGKVGAQTSSNGSQILTGGGDKILMPQNWNPQNWVQQVIDKTTGQTYTFQQFSNAFPNLIN